MKFISTPNLYRFASDFSCSLKEKFNLPIKTFKQNSKFLVNLGIKFCLILGLLFSFGGAVKAQTNALSFDGNNKINLNTSIGNFGTSDFTVEVKIKIPATIVTRALIAKRNVCGGSNFYNFVITANGFVALEISSGPPAYNDFNQTGTIKVDDNVAHMITILRKNNVYKTYVDGVLDIVGNGAVGNPISITNGNMAQIGDYPCVGFGPLRFNGTMDELRYWSRALCLEEINNNKNCKLVLPQTGLSAYYDFDQGTAGGNNTSQTTLSDKTTNGNNGTLLGFALTSGSASNFVAGLVSTNCTAFTASTPTISPAGTVTRCSGTAYPILTSSVSDSYQWSLNGSAISGATAQTYQTTANGSFTVTTGCGISSSATTIVEKPTPDVAQPTNQVVCNNVATTAVNFTGSVTGTVYNWVNNTTSIGLAASGSGDIASFTGFNTTNAPIVSTITVTPSAGTAPYAYIANYGTNNVSVINTATNMVIATVSVGSGPFSLSVSLNGSRVYVANLTSNDVSVINTATNMVVATVAVGSQPSGVSVSPDGSRVYVTSGNSSSVSVIDAASNTVVATVPVQSNPRILSVSPDGSRVYVPHVGSNNVSVINTATNSVLTTVAVGSSPYSVSVSPDGSRVYVANTSSNNVSVINTATNSVLTTVAVGSSPYGITVSPDGSRVYVTNSSSANVSVINTASNTVVATVAVGSTPFGISVSSDGSRVYVANTGSGTVSVINTANNTVMTTVAVGSAPYSVGNFITAGTPSCTGAAKTFTISVNPTPNVVATPSTQTICSGSAITTIALTGTVTGTVYSWTRDNTGVTGITASGTGDISGSLTNTTNAAVTVTFTITPTANGCTGTPITATVVVNPTPDVAQPTNQVVCNNTTTGAIILTGSVPGTVYNWVNNTTSIGLAASGSGNIASFTGINTTNAPVTATVTVTPQTGAATNTFNYTGALQTWTVPVGVTSVNLNAVGAQGGSVSVSCTANGGLGAMMKGDFAVTPGEILNIMVGQQGGTTGEDGGGGGGTFIVRGTSTPLLVAGGGGGATNGGHSCGNNNAGINASITTSGTASNNGLVAGGTNGAGGGAGGGNGGGGGGFSGDGTPGATAFGGARFAKSYLNGGAGGNVTGNAGGYGGGGCSWSTSGNGGGGGGYSGGGTSEAFPYSGGGGGGSYNAGTNQLNTAGVQTGNGQLIISYYTSPACTGSAKTFTYIINPTPNAVATPFTQTICNGSSISTISFHASSILANATQTITLANQSGSSTMGGVAYNPLNSLYYVVKAGTPSYDIKTYPNAGGAAQFSTPGNQDYRGLWWNSNLNKLEGNFYNGGYRAIDLDGLGNATGSGTDFSSMQPDPQSMGSYDAVANQLIFYNVGKIYSYDHTTFALISSATITGLPVPASNLTEYVIGYSGIAGKEIIVYDNTNKRAYFINKATGAYSGSYSQLPMSAPSAPSYDAAVTNGQLFLNDGTNYIGYKILNAGAGNIVGTVYNWTRDNTGVTGIAPSGSGDISGNLTNTTNAPVTVTFTITQSYTNAGVTCTGTPMTATVVVNPTADVAQPTNQAVCNNTATTAVNFTGSVTGTTYSWANDNISTGLAASGSGDIASFTGTNTSNAPIVSTVTVTPYLNLSNNNALLFNGSNKVSITNTPTIPAGNSNYTIEAWVKPNSVNGANGIIGWGNWGSSNEVNALRFNGPTQLVNYWWGYDLIVDIPNVLDGQWHHIVATCNGTVRAIYMDGILRGSDNPGIHNVTVTNNLHIAETNPGELFDGAIDEVRIWNIGKTQTEIQSNMHSGVPVNSAGLAAYYKLDEGTGNAIADNTGNGNSGTLTNSPTWIVPSNSPVGCSGTPKTFTITVNPTATVNVVSDQIVCNSAQTSSVTFSGAVAGTVYNWTNNTASIGLAATGTGNIAAFTATNTTGASVLATITATPVYTNAGITCNGTPITFTITVNPTNTITLTSAPATTSQNVLVNTAITNITYSTNIATGATVTGLPPGVTGNWASNVVTISGTPTTAGTFNYTVTLTGGGSCGTLTATGTITVYNCSITLTSAPATTSQTVCRNSAIANITYSTNGATGATFTGLPAGVTGNWAANVVTISGTPTAAGTFNYTATLTGGNCGAFSASGTITVNPTPTVAQPISQIVCNNTSTAAINYTGSVTGTNYTWTNNTTSIGLVAGGTGNIPSFTATNTTTSPIVATVTVTPSTGNAAGTTTLNYTGSMQTWTVPVGVTSVNLTAVGAQGGSVTVICAANGGLGAKMRGDFAVTPGEVLNIMVGQQGLTNGEDGGGGGGTFIVRGTSTALLVAGGGGGASNDIQHCGPNRNGLNATITTSGTASGNGAVAGGTAGNGGGASSGSGGGGAGFLTNGAAGTGFSNGNGKSYLNGGAGGIGFNNNIGGYGGGGAGWGNGGNGGGGGGYSGGATSGSQPFSGGGGGGSFNGGTNQVNTAAVQSGNGQVIITYGSGVNCIGTSKTFTITVNPTPDVTQPSNQKVCNNTATGAVNFMGSVAGTNFTWTNNTTSIGLAASGTGNIASFTATNTTTAPVTATIMVTPSYTNAGVTCVGTPRTFTITVNPTATVNPVANQVLCNNFPTTAVTFTSPTTGGTIVYNWTNNTTSIGLAATGTGNIASFTATNTTTAPVTATITVTPSYTNAGVTCVGTPRTYTYTVNPTGTVTAVTSQVICNGSPTTAVTFTSPTTGGTIVYNWTNNTTSIGLAATGTGNIASFTATNTTTAPVVATIIVTPSYTNGGVTCVGTPTTFTYTVNPTATVNVVANQVICNLSLTTAVTFTSPTTGGTIVYNWTNNTTSIGLAASGTGNIASFTATNTTTAPVTATIMVTPSYTNAGVTCVGTPRTFTITVNPTATVNPVANQVLCNNFPTTAVTFTSPTTGGTIVYNWTNNTTSIGLAATGTGNIASFTATNTTQVPVVATITVTPSYTNAGVTCVGTPITYTYTVNPTPIVTLAPFAPICKNGAPITLTGGSPVAGAGTTGVYLVDNVAQTIFNPANYTSGLHTIVYVYTNVFGCVNSATQTILVLPIHTVEITVAPNRALSPNSPLTVVATVSPVDNYTYVWRRNGTVVSGANGDRITVLANDAGNYTVTVTAPTGCVVVSSSAFTPSASVPQTLFIFPNPNTGVFNVSYNNGGANLNARTLNVYDTKGQRVFSQNYSVNVPFGNMKVDIRKYAKGLYYVVLNDSTGKKLASAAVEKL